MSGAVEARLAAIEARLAALESGNSTGGGASSKGGKIADDKTFQGAYGNPEATIDPKAWDGASMKGNRFSDCPAEWLDAAAIMYDAFGERAERDGKLDKNNKPVAWRDHQKAALARRWAQELRKEAGSASPRPQASQTKQEPEDDGSELPF